MELVSVVIPAFNAQRFLARTLASALAQTYKNIEVLVIDDGSTDDTRSIIEEFAASDGRVRSIRTQNRGVALARNLGIQNARGSYIAFLDADDLWHPTKIERQVEAIDVHRSDASWAGVYTFHRTIDESDQFTGNGQTVRGCSGYILARNFVLKFIGNGSNLLVRRDAALAVGGFDPSYAAEGIGGCEDLDFELRLAARYRIEAVRLFLVGYRVYKGNMSSDGSRMARSMSETIARHAKLNHSIPLRAKRWAVANAHRYAFQVLLRERKIIPALAAYGMLTLSDPVASILTAAEVLAAFRKRLTKARSVASSQAFMSMDPRAGADNPVEAIVRTKLSRLAKDDLVLEQQAHSVAFTKGARDRPETNCVS